MSDYKPYFDALLVNQAMKANTMKMYAVPTIYDIDVGDTVKVDAFDITDGFMNALPSWIIFDGVKFLFKPEEP